MIVNQNKVIENEAMTKTTVKTFLGGLSENERDFFEERAAIMEFDGGMCKEKAEICISKRAGIKCPT